MGEFAPGWMPGQTGWLHLLTMRIVVEDVRWRVVRMRRRMGVVWWCIVTMVEVKCGLVYVYYCV